MLEQFKSHLKLYFNTEVSLPPLMYAILYILITCLFGFCTIFVTTPAEMNVVFEGDVLRFSMSLRLLMFVYELFLIPLYLKRLKSIGWEGLYKDLAILGLLLPPVLGTFLSDGGYLLMLPIIAVLRFLALALTGVLFFAPHKEK